jgi:hypothetical protein
VVIRRLLVLALLAGLPLIVAGPVRAASKIAIAAAGDPAPGGGVFAGPSFVGEPAAAGNGWVAFRSLVTDGQSPEAIIATNFATRARVQVARVGQTVSPEIGRIKQFLGRPTINAAGDVAFAAEITPPDDAPRPDSTPGLLPTPAGVFLWSNGTLSVIAKPWLETAIGILDPTTPVNFLTLETGVDIAERTPALNDMGEVAFVAATLDGTTQRGAIFRGRAGQDPTPVLTLGTTWEDRRFAILGPPALNNAGVLAFRGVAEGRGGLDGIFTLGPAGVTLLVRDGSTPDTLAASFSVDPMAELGDVVFINDAGDVLCTGGPFFDNSDNANFDDIDGSPGVILIKSGERPLLVGFPGQEVPIFEARLGRISELTLGPEQGSRPAVPALGPDGAVVFFAIVNNGSRQGIFRVDPVTRTVFPLVLLGGLSADPTPLGGTYLSASSSPTLDAAGNVSFTARVQGGGTSEILAWRSVTGEQDALAIGDAVPDPARGYLAGPAFFPPILNDAGDVIFKAYVARGQGGLGIFRYRDGQVSPVVRVGDPAPLDGSPAFTNLVGDPSLSDNGAVAFAAVVAGRGRGIFVANGGAMRAIAMPSDDLLPADPLREGAFIKTVAAGPSLDESGEAVVFRGVVQYQDPLGSFFPDVREACVFRGDASGVHVLAAQGGRSGAALPFWSFRDPVIRGQTVVSRGTIATPAGLDEREGLFLLDGRQVRALALAGQDLGGGMTFSAAEGKALLDAAGDVFFLANVALLGDQTGAAVMRSTGGQLQPILKTGDRGPEGGLIRSISRPSVSSTGSLAMRLGFEPFTGGVAGIFLGRGGSPLSDSYLRIGEGSAARINGRVTSINPKISLNGDDRLAVLASIGGGAARSAILLAAPATLSVRRLAIRRGPPLTTRDGLDVSAVLEPGTLPPPPLGTAEELALARPKAISVSVADSVGPVWSGTLGAGDTRTKRHTLIGSQGKSGRIARLRVRFLKSGAMRLTLRARPFDLSFTAAASLDRRYDENGGAILVPPFFVRVDVGEDGASGSAACKTRRRRVRCGG